MHVNEKKTQWRNKTKPHDQAIKHLKPHRMPGRANFLRRDVAEQGGIVSWEICQSPVALPSKSSLRLHEIGAELCAMIVAVSKDSSNHLSMNSIVSLKL